MFTAVALSAVAQASPLPVVPTVLLNNGLEMPVMLWGSGGPTSDNSTSTASAVTTALEVGFTGIDTANHYHNQKGVAAGIANAKKKSSDIWLQTKVEPCGNSIITPLRQGHCYNDTLYAFQENLVELGASVVDMTLIHGPPCVLNSTWADPQCYWPDQPDAVYPQNCNCRAQEPCKMMQQQWLALEKMLHLGKTRAIGVSNFCQACLECILQIATVTPAVNQLQFHVGMGAKGDRTGLLEYNKHKGIVVQAYSPLASDLHSKLFTNPIVVGIANGLNKTPAQVCLKWILQQGYPLATSTVSKIYMEQDLQVWGWQLRTEDLTALSALTIGDDDPVKSMCLLG